MARINIEDSLFRDSRFLNLLIKLGCEYKALGYVTKAWSLAQVHWLEYKCVPKKAWLKDLDILIEVELATLNEDGSVYVKGSKKAFSWLEQKSNAGRKGGLKRRQNVEAGAKRGEAGLSGSKPPTLSPTLSLTQESNTNTIKRKSAPDLLSKIERLYFDHYPLKKGKSKGVTILSKHIKNEEDLLKLELAIKKYAASISDPKFTKHFSTFANEWSDWLDENAGQVENKNKLDVNMSEEDFLKMINKGIL